MRQIIALSILVYASLIFAAALEPNSYKEPSYNSTLTPEPVVSLFEEDPCAPPCWFGLVPGESTAADVVAMAEQFDNIFTFDPDQVSGTFDDSTGYLVDGYYSLGRHEATRYSTDLRIDDGVLRYIHTYMEPANSLEDTLTRLGQPNSVHVFWHPYSVFISLSYIELHLNVTLNDDRETCQMSSFLQDYQVVDVWQYSPIEAAERFGVGQPLDETDPISDNDWEVWLNGEVSGLCLHESWRVKGLATLIPDPTPSPTP